MLEALAFNLRAAVRERLNDAERKQRCAALANAAFGEGCLTGQRLRKSALHDIAVAGQMICILGMLEAIDDAA